MRRKSGLWLFVGLLLPVIPACSQADPKASAREAEIKKLRAELGERDWEIAKLKAKLGGSAAPAAETRDLLIGKWELIGQRQNPAVQLLGSSDFLEFTKDGEFKETIKGQEGSVLGGVGPDATVGGHYLWLDDDHIIWDLILDEEGHPVREKHKVDLTKDDLTITDPDGNVVRYKRAK